jgi:hypothetical protein
MQEKDLVIPMKGTCGQNSSGSSGSADLQQLLESRLKRRFGMDGSIEYSETWKAKATPAGRLYLAHTASARRTSDSDCIGWAAPAARDWKSGKTSQAIVDRNSRPLSEQTAMLVPGPTVKTAGWGTPRVSDGTLAETTKMPPSGPRSRLELEVLMAGWNTPTCPSITGTHQSGSNRFTKSIRESVSGPTTNGLNVETEDRGELNPDFSRWLMGFPIAWSSCADTAMQLSLK